MVLFFLAWLFPIAFLGALITWIVGMMLARSWCKPSAALVIAFMIAYALGVVVICLDPYWEDNGVLEFIEWRDRWVSALLPASGFSIFLIPAMLWLSTKIRSTPPAA